MNSHEDRVTARRASAAWLRLRVRLAGYLAGRGGDDVMDMGTPVRTEFTPLATESRTRAPLRWKDH